MDIYKYTYMYIYIQIYIVREIQQSPYTPIPHTSLNQHQPTPIFVQT